jgi:small subunit ribosomal protein S6
MNPYEVLVMFDAELTEDAQSEIVSRAKEIVAKAGGAWHGAEVWGLRKLAYEIDHKTDAHYQLLTFDSTAAALDELTRILKINEGVIRHLATRRIEQAAQASSPEPATATT